MTSINYLLLKTTLFITGFISCSSILAQIPPELIYQTPENIPTNQLATIQGTQKESTVLKSIDARVYITYINTKATLSKPSEWDKTYSMVSGETEIRFAFNNQSYFGNGAITFEAKPIQHYQLKASQPNVESHQESILFWIENSETGEIVSPKKSIYISATPKTVNYLPIILSK